MMQKKKILILMEEKNEDREKINTNEENYK